MKKIEPNFKENYTIKGFSKLCSKVAACKKCFEEFTMLKFYNFFDGTLYSPLLIVGQSPIYPLPDIASRPFSLINDKREHRGSRFLRNCMTEAGLDYKNCYITNLVKDSAIDNKITPKMISNCSGYLETEIKMFKGRVILAFGKAACKYFKVNPTETRKLDNGKYVLGSYHPAYYMRRGAVGADSFIRILKNTNELISGPENEKTLLDYIENSNSEGG